MSDLSSQLEPFRLGNKSICQFSAKLSLQDGNYLLSRDNTNSKSKNNSNNNNNSNKIDKDNEMNVETPKTTDSTDHTLQNLIWGDPNWETIYKEIKRTVCRILLYYSIDLI
jgi:hypothetical protein